ncbi:ketopantoate reductase family protein [Effusibacillus pohliae]|uniref:ketopantoate reductase family protein n=1 Tax=Effusibacillus pohliae TaxID=232270 RepID=UPI00037BE984|nr:2-dehydropantoate 2-reductase [Effusibacillus pohliae]
MDGAEPIRIGVLGAGAVGKLTAAALVSSGMSVRLLVRRQEQAASLRQNGLVLVNSDGKRLRFPVAVSADPVAEAVDLVMVTVKSIDTEQAARQVAAMPGTPCVLSLQNGLGNGETLAALLGPERVLLGVSTYGATAQSDYEVAARGSGELVVGGYLGCHPLADKLAAIFSKAGWNVRVSSDMQREVWKKALVNIGINPVTAIHRVPNGAILERPDLRQIAVAAVWEAGQVAQGLGVLSADEAAAGVERMLLVCRATAANRSSMLQDVEKGRRTEIGSLNGAVVRMADELSVATPVNRELVNRIRQIEAGNCDGAYCT